MKRFTCLISCLFIVSFQLLAQTDFISFIDSIDWSLNEKEFVTQTKEKARQVKHKYFSHSKTTIDYEVVGIRLADYLLNGEVEVDSLSRKIKNITFHLPEEVQSLPFLDISHNMDEILFGLFGQPDKMKNDLDSKYLKSLDREWFLDNYSVSVRHMIFPDNSSNYSITVTGSENPQFDFRQSKWGDSIEEVKGTEHKSNKHNFDNMYVFDSSVAGIPCEVIFVFADNKLSLATYSFCESHTNQNDYILDYTKLVKLLSQKYGKPDVSTMEWRNKLYKDEPERYGFAISLGHIIYHSVWEKDKTEIEIVLKGENYKLELAVIYRSKKYIQLLKGTLDQNSIDVL